MPYYAKRGTDAGTVDEITIHNPTGGLMATIQFWPDEPDDVRDAEAQAELIVNALNAYKGAV